MNIEVWLVKTAAAPGTHRDSTESTPNPWKCTTSKPIDRCSASSGRPMRESSSPQHCAGTRASNRLARAPGRQVSLPPRRLALIPVSTADDP